MVAEPGTLPIAEDEVRGPRVRLHHLLPWLAILAIILAWEACARIFQIPQWLLPAPTAIVRELAAQPRLFAGHALVTTGEIVLGFALSVAIGIPLAVGMAYSRTFERTLYPILVSSQAVPKVAVAPLLIVWFGFGALPKVMVAFLIAFFPIVIDTVVGLRSVEPEMLHLARSMGASAWQTFVKIRLPKALPSIFAGLKVAITLAVVGATVGEFVAADRGLGYMLMVASGEMNSRMLFAAIIVLTLIGVGFFLVLEAFERLLMPWRGVQTQEGVHGTA